MNKELQDLVWSILPKEFREEVKKIYQDLTVDYDKYAKEDAWDTANAIYSKICILREVFGWNNLTSDAEGEEMLTVEKGKVQFMFDGLDSTRVNDEYDRGYKAGKEFILHGLFGSKCLPDNVDSLDSNVDSLEPKPAVPKLRRGSFAYHDKVKVRITKIKANGDVIAYTKDGYRLIGRECDFEPYTEPTETFTDDCQSQCKSQNHPNRDLCDKLMRRGFRDHNRLNIATRIATAILGNPDEVYRAKTCGKGEQIPQNIAEYAVAIADALIAEAEIIKQPLKETNKYEPFCSNGYRR